jgi:methionyl aminopeptidase
MLQSWTSGCRSTDISPTPRTTIDLGTNSLLIQASSQALESAISKVKPGTTAGELGAVIQTSIEGRGYRPISNLTGHGLDQFILHQSPTIPNIGMTGGVILEEGMVFAIEPFATTGSGHVGEKIPDGNIFPDLTKTCAYPGGACCARKSEGTPRSPVFAPLAYRTETGHHTPSTGQVQTLHVYPVLSDIPGSLVSQHEHTVIVTSDGCVVTTR